MQDKKEILLTPAKTGMGLSETERLEVGRLMLKAGYRVTFVKRRPPGKTAGPPEYAKDVFGAISPVLKKVLPAARMKAIRQIDILSRAKNRLEELMEAEHETD